MEQLQNYPEHKTRKRRKGVPSILWYIIPFVLINAVIFYFMTAQPDFTLTITDPGDFKTEEVTVDLNCRLPLSDFYMKLDDADVQMEQVTKKQYRATIDRNGTLEVTAAYRNGMVKTQYAPISTIDDIPPTILGEEIDQNVFTVSLEDTQSGINLASVYAIDADGKRVAPMASSDTDAKNLVRFQALTDSLEVHASDQNGNEAVVSFDGLKLMGNSGEDRSYTYNTYGESDTDTSSSSGSSKSSSGSSSGSSSSSSKSSSGSSSGSSSSKSSSGSSSGSSGSKSSSGSSSGSSSSKSSSGSSSGSSSSKSSSGSSSGSSKSSKSTETSESEKTTTAAAESTETEETTASAKSGSETSSAAKVTESTSKSTESTEAAETASTESADTAESTTSSSTDAPGAVISESVSAPTAASVQPATVSSDTSSGT